MWLHHGEHLCAMRSIVIFLPLIVSFLPHLTYSTLHPPPSFLCFHASKQFPHHRNVTIFFLVFHPLSSNAVPFRGMPHTPLCSYAFLRRERTGLFSCCAFCGLTTCATLSSTLHCITLLLNTSNLFWGMTVLFSLSFLFLQL